MVWHGVVWCGMVWCGVAWQGIYGMVWYGMVWHGACHSQSNVLAIPTHVAVGHFTRVLANGLRCTHEDRGDVKQAVGGVIEGSGGWLHRGAREERPRVE